MVGSIVTRAELLEQLYQAVKSGVQAVHALNEMRHGANGCTRSFVAELEQKERMDAAWAEINRLLAELENAQRMAQPH